jgi:acyl-CoA hydrolase
MDYQAIYRQKRITVDDALGLIQDNDNVVSGGVGMEAFTLLSNLHRLHGKVKNIKYCSGLGMYAYPFFSDPKYRDTFQVDCIFFMDPARKAHRAGLLNVYPAHLHNGLIRWLQVRDGRRVCMLSATPMDRHGYFRLPVCLIQEKYMIENADLVILEINPQLPVVFGETEVHISDVDYLIETDHPLPILPQSTPTETDRTIGQYIAELVPDGSCIQLGIGGIPDAAAQALMTKHDLGVHTEMLTNSLVDLVEAGVITGKRKNLDQGKIVGSFVLGDQRLYDMITENPGVAIMRGQYVNNPATIAKINNFVSINTGLTVDLSGQICSETIGSLHYSGSGGQADTAIGATHSKGGKNIIAIQSVKETKAGRVSCINAQLPLGSVVTLSRNDVDYIVTEYGIAPMRGRSVRQRVENLAAVAHPDYRAELRKTAEKLLLW